MATFTFVAQDKQGAQVTGVRSAASRQELIGRLRSENLTVTNLNEESAVAQAKKSGQRSEFVEQLLHGKVKNSQLMMFTRQFSAMLTAGISLTDAVQTIAHGISNQRLRKALLEIRADVQKGCTLTESMRRHNAIFDQLFLSMIQAGESSGSLAQNVSRLSHYLEKKENFRRKLKSATAYPKFVLGFFTVITLIIFLVLIPKFKEIFESFNAKLPAVTQMCMNISEFLRGNVFIIVPCVIGAIAGVMAFKRTERGQVFFDRAVLKVPFFGPLLLKAAVARLSMTLSTMLSNGIPLTDAMRIATQTVGNKPLEEGLRNARNNVMNGQGLAESLARIPELPRLLPRMVRVGEESGTLSGMLEDVSKYYDQEVDAGLSRITAVIEPVLICGMGVIVLITVIAIYLPIFSMSSNIRGG